MYCLPRDVSNINGHKILSRRNGACNKKRSVPMAQYVCCPGMRQQAYPSQKDAAAKKVTVVCKPKSALYLSKEAALVTGQLLLFDIPIIQKARLKGTWHLYRAVKPQWFFLRFPHASRAPLPRAEPLPKKFRQALPLACPFPCRRQTPPRL